MDIGLQLVDILEDILMELANIGGQNSNDCTEIWNKVADLERRVKYGI